ncbi:MAG: hypothetical protein NTZ80_03265 [Patescibacteria group bacterium]|nr:hypothetical protein [Patescibacteria group bacterium]
MKDYTIACLDPDRPNIVFKQKMWLEDRPQQGEEIFISEGTDGNVGNVKINIVGKISKITSYAVADLSKGKPFETIEVHVNRASKDACFLLDGCGWERTEF